MEHAKVINGKTIGAWKKYAENEYHYTPMAVVKYITILEEELSKLSQHDVSGRSEQLKCQCKRAKFTRTVDADFNPLCGRCGKAL